MRSLARALVARETDVDDLLQDTALAALERPPATDRSVRPWLAVVLRNRRRMDVRAERRARARDEAVAALTMPVPLPDELLQRERGLARVAAALAALDEPFHSVVIRHYLIGDSAIDIARSLGVPPSTIRWQLMTGRDRLRAALAAEDPQWRRALIPVLPAMAAKTGASIVALALALLVVAGGLAWWLGDHGGGGGDAEAHAVAVVSAGAPQRAGRSLRPHLGSPSEPGVCLHRWRQDRAVVEHGAGAGAVAGHVFNAATGEGVPGVELTFVGAGDGGVVSLRSDEGGGFELAPDRPGRYALIATSAPGFLPYAPEPQHSSVHVEVVRDRVVRGVALFVTPADTHRGMVVDRSGAPVAGAHVRLIGTPHGEQALDRDDAEWISAADGTFAFHAGDGAVLEAVRGTARGWAQIDSRAAITLELTIAIDEVAPRDGVISGRVVDAAGAPVADALVRAMPDDAGKAPPGVARATAFALTAADGSFALERLDRGGYDLATQADGRAPASRKRVPSGTGGLILVADPGEPLAGSVVDPDGAPVAAFTLLVWRVAGAVRELVVAHSIVDASGRFDIRVEPGDYELIATANGWAPGPPITTGAGARDVRLLVTPGASLRGTVTSIDGTPIARARVIREGDRGGSSAQPANPGTVTRSDGSFELLGLPPGPVSIEIGARGFHPRLEAGLTARDGALLGPLAVALTPLAPGERPAVDMVGIGASLSPEGDAVRVDEVYPGSGAGAAGIVAGDLITAVDGVSVLGLGLDRAISLIRGTAGTMVSLTLRRGEALVQLVVERRKIRM